MLFSGDTVYDGPLVTDAWHSSIDDYVRSMERLLSFPFAWFTAGISGASVASASGR